MRSIILALAFGLAIFSAGGQSFIRLAQISRVPDASMRQQAEATGIRFLRFLPGQGYIVAVNDTLQNPLPAWISGLKAVPRNVRVHPAVMNGTLNQECYNAADGTWRLMVTLYPGFSDEAVIGQMPKGVAATTTGYAGMLQVFCRADAETIRQLLAIAAVEYVEPCYPTPQPENTFGRVSHRSSFLAGGHNGLGTLDGTGVNVMMQDDGEIGPHIDHKGRVDQASSQASTGDHGDHVSGTIMGAGNLDPKGEGMARGALLYVYRAAPAYNGFSAMANAYNNQQVRITSTSYSDGCNGGYTGFTQTMDEQMLQYPLLMHVFSAGNEGTSDCGYGAGAGWGNITGGHKSAKNVIAVANMTATDGLASSSSRGPAHDGRIKPDVGAVGTNVYSTISNQNYAVFSGTSMSCPGTSGTIAQLYQAYNVVHGQDPEGALIKAILMNTADDKGNVGPDFRYGFGRINARRALNVITGSAHFSAAADQGDTTTYPLIVPGGLKQLKLMLYWHDLEATPGAQIALVNDLDLRLVSPAGDTILPWVLDTTATPAALNTPATRGHDHVNNVEQVVVDTPAAGNWQVVVIGHQVPFGPQPAVFTYDFMDEGITVVYPNGDEGFVPLENEMVRWDAPDDTTGFDLSYSADNGTTWTPVASVGSSVRLYSWYIPDTLSGQCLFRVERGGVSDISNAPFSIIGVPTGLAVTWSCEDSSRLSWNPVAGATGYEVFRLGSRYMEPVDTVADTTVVLQGIGLFDEEWFSVRAHGPLGANGRRAVAVQKPVGFAACPLKFDAMTEEVIVPGSGTIQNCHNLTALQVKMVLRNNGVDTLSAIPVNYRLNGGPVRSDVYAPDLLPGASVAYEFTFTENLSAAGTYITEVWVDYPGDDNSYNDTVITEMRVIAGSTVSAPVTEDFEGMNNCATFGCTFTCALGNGWTNVQNSTTDDIDFRVFSGTTPSDLTGPGGSDFMPGIPSGTYAYIESTSCSNRQAVMLSPCIDLTGVSQPLLTFGGHFYGGPDMGELHVDVFEGGAWYPDVLSPQSGNAGNFWLTRQADLSAFAGKVITVRFRADSGDDERGDMAIDGIRIGALMSVEEQVQEIRLYPNPADEVLYIAGPEGVRWQVLDLQGRAVAEGMGTIAQLAHVSAGVYVIVLEIDGVRRTSRFVKN